MWRVQDPEVDQNTWSQVVEKGSWIEQLHKEDVLSTEN